MYLVSLNILPFQPRAAGLDHRVLVKRLRTVRRGLVPLAFVLKGNQQGSSHCLILTPQGSLRSFLHPSSPWYPSWAGASCLYLQLSPLDPAHTAGSVAPGLLGPKHQLTLPELVGACGCHLSLHLLKPLFMSLGTTPGERGGPQALVSGQWEGWGMGCEW